MVKLDYASIQSTSLYHCWLGYLRVESVGVIFWEWTTRSTGSNSCFDTPLWNKYFVSSIELHLKDLLRSVSRVKCSRALLQGSIYTPSQMYIIYAGLVCVSVISVTSVMASVFHLAELEFTCLTKDEMFHSTCPENKVSNCMFVEYNRSVWSNNLIMEMDLVCDRAWMKTLPYYGWFAGMLVNTVTMPLSDLCGRWTLIITSQAGLTVTLFLSAASKSIHMYR